MEIIIGLVIFSMGAMMASHMYCHCVHSSYLAWKVSSNSQQSKSGAKD
jgi:hypothetical protein